MWRVTSCRGKSFSFLTTTRSMEQNYIWIWIYRETAKSEKIHIIHIAAMWGIIVRHENDKSEELRSKYLYLRTWDIRICMSSLVEFQSVSHCSELQLIYSEHSVMISSWKSILEYSKAAREGPHHRTTQSHPSSHSRLRCESKSWQVSHFDVERFILSDMLCMTKNCIGPNIVSYVKQWSLATS